MHQQIDQKSIIRNSIDSISAEIESHMALAHKLSIVAQRLGGELLLLENGLCVGDIIAVQYKVKTNKGTRYVTHNYVIVGAEKYHGTKNVLMVLVDQNGEVDTGLFQVKRLSLHRPKDVRVVGTCYPDLLKAISPIWGM